MNNNFLQRIIFKLLIKPQMYIFYNSEMIISKLDSDFVSYGIKKSHLFIDQFNLHTGIIYIVFNFFWFSSPANYKLFLKNKVMVFKIPIPIVNKINYSFESHLDVVFGRIFY